MMLRDIRFVAFKDLRYMLRERETLLWVFLMPIVFFFFIGTVTGGFSGRENRQDRLAVKTGGQPGFIIDQLERRLSDRDFEIVRPETDSLFALYARQLTVPAGFTDSILAGTPVALQFRHRTTALGGDYDRIRVARAVYTVLADLIVASETGGRPTAESFDSLNAMPHALSLEVASAGRRKTPPSGFQQAIPGITVMFILMVMATSGAILLVIERRQGLLRRLACTPISRTSVVLGKWGGKMMLGVVQISFAVLSGTIIFKMNWGPNLAAVIAVLVVYGALMATLGILLGSLARTEGQAIGIGVVSANVLAALGGCWWPIEVTPGWMQKLQLFLPTGWAMDAMHKLISFADDPLKVLPHLVGMLLFTVLLVPLSVRAFRYQ
jgi:ABC-2 type transport system permease protein